MYVCYLISSVQECNLHFYTCHILFHQNSIVLFSFKQDIHCIFCCILFYYTNYILLKKTLKIVTIFKLKRFNNFSNTEWNTEMLCKNIKDKRRQIFCHLLTIFFFFLSYRFMRVNQFYFWMNYPFIANNFKSCFYSGNILLYCNILYQF